MAEKTGELDIDGIEEGVFAILDRLPAVKYTPEYLRDVFAEARDARALRERVATLEGGIRTLKTVVEGFGVERTDWVVAGPLGRVSGSAPGLSIPEDCDTCEVVIESDVYESMTDVLDLLEASPDDKDVR